MAGDVNMRRADGVRRRVAEDQIDVCRVELLGRLPGSGFAVDHADVADLAPDDHPLGDELVVAEQAVEQAVELVPVVPVTD